MSFKRNFFLPNSSGFLDTSEASRSVNETYRSTQGVSWIAIINDSSIGLGNSLGKPSSRSRLFPSFHLRIK